jgi:cytochrome c oxidase subunit 2
MTPLEAGKMLFNTRGCTQCHSVDGTRLIGPSLMNVYGEEQPMSDGAKVMADDNYIMESIYDPNAKIVLGYAPQMPSYKASLKDKDVGAIIAYLRSISERHKNEGISLGAPTTTASTTAPTTAPQ